MLAEIHSWQKDYSAADHAYRRLLEVQPGHWQARLQHARVLTWAGRHSDALVAYSQLTEFPPDVQPLIALERQAKTQLAHRQLMGCLEVYCELLEDDPENLEVHFDLGQIYCRLGLPSCSRPHYHTILELEPHHDAARRVLEASWTRCCPKVEGGYVYWWEEGRDDLKDVKRHREYLRAIYPMQGGDAELTISAWHSLYELKRLEDQNVGSIGIHWKIAPWLRMRWENWANLNFFTDKSGTSCELGGELRHYAGDAMVLSAGVALEDLLDNHFLFLNHVQSTQAWLQWELPLGCHWDLRSRATHRWFSDNNSGWLGDLTASYAVTLSPCLLRVSAHGFGYHVRKPTIAQYSGGHVLSAIHPYWTADHYLQGALSFQWQHHPCDDFFCEIDPLYYDLQYQVALDRDDEVTHSFRAELSWDCPDSWSLKAVGYYLNSKPYKAAQAELSLGRRL